jgi:hypothetical protein
MSETREEILERRRRTKAEYGPLFDSIVALLFQHDPVGIKFESNTDEYEPEAEAILPRLNACQSVENVRQVVHEEFVRWFDPSTVGRVERYTQIAIEIWALWQKRNIL